MAIYLTEIIAICSKTKMLLKWAGENIEAESIEEAQKICNDNGKGYLIVIGELIEEVKPNENDVKVINLYKNNECN